MSKSKSKELRRLAEQLVAGAWCVDSLLHGDDPVESAVIPLRRWSLGTLRDANKLARMLGVEPMYRKRRAPSTVPTRPVLRLVKGGA